MSAVSNVESVPVVQSASNAEGTRGTRRQNLERRLVTSPVWTRWLAASFLIFVVATSMVARYIPSQPSLSRADEYVYIDAVDKAARGDITRRGALIDEYALVLLSCRGVSGYPAGAPCGGDYTREGVPWENGHTSADIHPPTYFFLTAWIAKVILKLTPINELLTAARLTGALWLSLGLIGTAALARSLGATRLATAAVVLLTLAAPSMRWVSTYVTPDALNLLIGSSVALAAVQYLKRRWSPWILVIFCLLAGTIKAQNLMAAGLVGLLFGLHAGIEAYQRGSWRPLARVGWAVLALVATAIPQAVWFVIRAQTAVGPAPGQGLASPPLGLRSIAYDSTVFMTGVVNGPDATYPGAWIYGNPMSLHGQYVTWLFVAGMISLALFARRTMPLQGSFGRAALLAFLLGGPGLRVALYLSTGANFGLPERYGLVLLPAMVAATAISSHRRWVNWLLILVGLLFFAANLLFIEHW
ncbi:MAG: hypothetical protein ACOH2F_17740 [Cellulomonas sp.]